MALRSISLWTGMLLVAAALAGCAGDEPGAPAEDTPPAGGPAPGSGMDGPGGPSADVPGAQADPEPLFFNGTLTAPLDCTLAGTEVGAQSLDAHSIPEEAWGLPYALEVVGSDLEDTAGVGPGLESLCLGFDDEPLGASLSGTVPEGATTVHVGADAAYAVQYSLRIG